MIFVSSKPYSSSQISCWEICDAKLLRTVFILTVKLFFNLEGDRLSSHLQQVDGFTQRLAFKTDAVNSQNPIPYVNSPCPGHTWKHTNSHTHIGKRTHRHTVMCNSVLLQGNNMITLKPFQLQRDTVTPIVHFFPAVFCAREIMLNVIKTKHICQSKWVIYKSNL